MVSPFCLGAVPGDPATVEAAFDAGINFFFYSGDLHWPLYERTRRGLAQLLASRPSVRDEIVVAATSYVDHDGFVNGALNEGLLAVPGLGRIDMYVIGGLRKHDFIGRLHHAERLRARGFVRSIAATFHDRRSAVTAYNGGLLDIAFTRYNPLHPGARLDTFPALASSSTAKLFNFKNTVGWVPPSRLAALGLADSHWRPTFGDYYRFVLSQPKMDGLLCALAEPREVHDLARTLESGPLTAEEETYLIGLAALGAGRARMKREAPANEDSAHAPLPEAAAAPGPTAH
jgi:hypothetical protein